MEKTFAFLGAVSAFLSVALGAFAAHILKEKIAPNLLDAFEVGVRYQMFHALALIVIPLLAARWGSPSFVVAGWFFVVGTVLFSGSLYALALSGVKGLGIITPLGGLCFLAGWLFLAWCLL